MQSIGLATPFHELTLFGLPTSQCPCRHCRWATFRDLTVLDKKRQLDPVRAKDDLTLLDDLINGAVDTPFKIAAPARSAALVTFL